jgi:hypothetical protein
VAAQLVASRTVLSSIVSSETQAVKFLQLAFYDSDGYITVNAERRITVYTLYIPYQSMIQLFLPWYTTPL